MKFYREPVGDPSGENASAVQSGSGHPFARTLAPYHCRTIGLAR
jgi:hypothetical protein